MTIWKGGRDDDPVIRFLENPPAQRLARVHLHFLWQGLVVAIAAWLLLAALRRSSADARYVSLVILLGSAGGLPGRDLRAHRGGPGSARLSGSSDRQPIERR